MSAVPAEWVCRRRMCGRGGAAAACWRSRGSCPAAHAPPHPARDAAGFSYFWNLNGQPRPACDERCHLRVGVGRAPAPRDTVTRAFFPKPGARYQRLVCHPPWGLGVVGTWHERGRSPRGPSFRPRSSASVRPSVPTDTVVAPALQVCPQEGILSLRALPGSVGSSRPSVAPQAPVTAVGACHSRPAQGSVGHVQ